MLRADDISIVVDRSCLPPWRFELQLRFLLFLGVRISYDRIPIAPLICRGGGPERANGGYGSDEVLLSSLCIGVGCGPDV